MSEEKPFQLTKILLEHGISLLELAARTGLPKDYLSKIECGEILALEGDVKRIRKAVADGMPADIFRMGPRPSEEDA
ncbi:MAG: helix-turn-helix transcriptional regulator [Candidatus Omnitrophota bacterium]|nr:helix-turn-helix transcriptional regulator [Candidatus Omnitrophota bacterium]